MDKKIITLIKSGWFIVYIEGPQVIISKTYCIFSLKIDFVLLANSADPDEMPVKYPFKDSGFIQASLSKIQGLFKDFKTILVFKD